MGKIDAKGRQRSPQSRLRQVAFSIVLITGILLTSVPVKADEKEMKAFPLYLYLYSGESGKILITNIEDKFILERGELWGNDLFDGGIKELKQAQLVIPYLSFFEPPVESASLFYLLAGRSRYVDEYFSYEETRKYKWYAEFLKDILLNFDLDRMIKSGKYGETESDDLASAKDDKVITNINTVIMWTALQTRDIDYAAKTYLQLKEYEKRKPDYLEYYLEVMEGVHEPLPFDDLTIEKLLGNIKKVRGSK